MKKIIFVLTISLFINQLSAKINKLVHRSEYEKVGDLIHDINDPSEGSFNYSILSGNNNGYYKVDSESGAITVASEINDRFGAVHTDILKINAGGTIYEIEIVDGYDYFLDNLPTSYSILDDHEETFVDPKSEWTVYNNLWGKGSAIPNVDFRIAMLHKQKLPDTCILIWDVPCPAEAYGGASVWCYSNVLWGNRLYIRKDLQNFPFQIKSLNKLKLKFDFEKLFGNDQFKVALNLFTFDETHVAHINKSDGDFFFVFDQINTWIPKYPYSLSDIKIMGKPFALRYNDYKDGRFRQRRRVIIKNNEKLMKGEIDLKHIFDVFEKENYINPLQYIPNIQLGIEVTRGYEAFRFNRYNIKL